MCQIDIPGEPFDDPDSEDELDWDNECDALNGILDEDWDAAAFETENDFYDELRDRYEDEDTI